MDLRRLKQQASRLSADGRFERAEVLYRQLLTVHPRDPTLWLRHAEILKRLERHAAAVASFRMAATLFSDAGHDAKATACLKMALEGQPDNIDLVTDIIRLELRQRQNARGIRGSAAQLGKDAGPINLESQSLALPMLPSAELMDPSTTGPELEPVPAPSTSAPRFPLEFEAPGQLRWPQVRRLSDLEIAVKSTPTSKWIVLKSNTSIDVRFLDECVIPDEAEWLEEP